MKKSIGIILAVLSLFSILLVSCKNDNAQSGAMEISSVSLTQQEGNIVDLLNVNKKPNIFDFTVDKKVKSIHLNCYELTNKGDWKEISSYNSLMNTEKGRIAFSFDVIGNGIEMSIQNSNGTSRDDYKPEKKLDTKDMSELTSINHKNSIQYEEEIPLIIQVVTSKSEIKSYDTEYFYRPNEYQKLGYEHVYALTISFSQKNLSK